MDGIEQEEEIVIIGGGVCGLATALALYRKGIRSVVLERSEKLRASGAAFGVLNNGWRALHQLGLASSLRRCAHPFHRVVNVWLDKDVRKELPISEGEARCLKRQDLMEALGNALPSGTIRFGCHVVSMHADNSSLNPIVQLEDGRIIKAKVLIGCDGAHSMVGDFLGLNKTKYFSSCAVRGLTAYPTGHGFTYEFLRIRKGSHLVGRIPIDEVTVYWFLLLRPTQKDAEYSKDPEFIKQLSLDAILGFPTEIIDMVKNSDPTTVTITHLRYRTPWNFLLSRFRKGAVVVAGDAMHVMGPFLGQGGSAALEDAIVLARCLSKTMYMADTKNKTTHLREQMIRDAFDGFIKERRMRLMALSTQSYLTGLLLIENPFVLVRVLCIVLMVVLFRDPTRHTRYDCGEL